jgi:hypothetical protein
MYYIAECMIRAAASFNNEPYKKHFNSIHPGVLY